MIRYIYTFFVGLFVAIFIGMGIAVFYAAPVAPESPNFYGGKELTLQEQEQLKAFDITQKAWDKDMQHYNRNASVIILSSAVIILVVSLLLGERVSVIADGLLLGGIFTLLYGIGRGMSTDSNKYRFLVATIGLVVTLLLGYVKFARQRVRKMKISQSPSDEGGVLLKILFGVMAVVLLAGSLYGTYTWQHQKVNTLNDTVARLTAEVADAKNQMQTPPILGRYISKKGVAITVYLPPASSHVTSPTIILGEVPGDWSFEASFPVKLIDAEGTVIAQSPAELQGDWMTDKLVPFTAKLTYSNAKAGDATLLLQKDNPSGDAANDDSLSIPVKL